MLVPVHLIATKSILMEIDDDSTESDILAYAKKQTEAAFTQGLLTFNPDDSKLNITGIELPDEELAFKETLIASEIPEEV